MEAADASEKPLGHSVKRERQDTLCNGAEVKQRCY